MTSHRSETAACAARALVTGTGRAAGSHRVSAAMLLNTGSARWPSGEVRVTAAMSVDFSTASSPEVSTSAGAATTGTSRRAAATAATSSASRAGVADRGQEPRVTLAAVVVEAGARELAPGPGQPCGVGTAGRRGRAGLARAHADRP